MLAGKPNLALAVLLASMTPAAAQEANDRPPPPEDAILVLDASGSMWARIDGKPRIVIAREVISGLLDDLPAHRRLGLMAYGHNRKGDCKDIETLVETGTDRDAIREAVTGINPRGKTPMTAAVRQAAERLKYGEDPATVILVSDGIETCGLDPCAIAATLEKTGVALTVHTVGFGLGAGEQAAKAQLQCMADNTGGRFLLANDAGELADALQEVTAETAEAVEPLGEATVEAPAAAPAASVVRVEWTGPDDEDDYITVTPPDAPDGARTDFTYTREGTPLDIRLPSGPGAYEVRYVSRETRTVLARSPIEATEVGATLEVPESAPAGSTIRVAWTGPGYEDDYIAVAEPDAGNARRIHYTHVREGNPLELKLPIVAGAYELRYVVRQDREVLAQASIQATPVTATLDVPAHAAAASTVQVAWTGPDYKDDYITIAAPDAPNHARAIHAYTRKGNPLELATPDEPGIYEVRYIARQSRTILARKTIEIR